MHFKIIFIGMEEKIVFDKGILEDVDGDYKKIYYKLNEDTVESLFFKEDYMYISNFISRGSIVVINDSNKLKAEEIKSIKNNKDICLVLGENNNKIIKFEKEFIFPYIYENDNIKIYDIILTLYNIFEYDSIIKNTSEISGVIGFTKRENLQHDILVSVLNNFKVIERCNEYNLVILSEEELGVDEIAYLEDPIREYTYKSSKFKINQNINENYKDIIYFCMMGI